MAKRFNPNPKLTAAQRKRRRNIDNARRRFDRQAKRFDQEANKLESDRRYNPEVDALREAAQALRDKSESLKGINVRETLSKSVKDTIAESADYMASALNTDFARGEAIGKARLSGTNLGHNFFALTEELWKGVPSTGKGDDSRLNAIRKKLAKDPEVRKKYGKNIDANQMIEIIEGQFEGSLDEPYTPGGSDDPNFIRAKTRINVNYG